MHDQPQVAPGYAVFTVGDRWVVRDPAGIMAAVRSDVVVGLDAPSELGEPKAEGVVAALTRAGVLQGEDVDESGVRQEHIAVGGLAVMVDPLMALLRSGGHVVSAADSGLASASVVTWCGTVPPAIARVLDARCQAGDLVWQRCMIEGGVAQVEPLGCGAHPLTHAMVRARRLAAAEHPDALRMSWSESALRGRDLLGPASVAFLTGLLARDLLALLAGDASTRLTRTLRTVDLLELTVEKHPILAVPECDWRESAL